MFVDRPDDAGAELDEVYDEAAHHKHKAHQQLQDEQTLQVGQKSHGWGARRVAQAPLYTLQPNWETEEIASQRSEQLQSEMLKGGKAQWAEEKYWESRVANN